MESEISATQGEMKSSDEEMKPAVMEEEEEARPTGGEQEQPTGEQTGVEVEPMEAAKPVLSEAMFRLIRLNDLATFKKKLDERPELLDAVHETSGESAVHWCVQESNFIILQELFLRGAPMDQRVPDTGMQPLHYAARSGFLKAVQLLVSKARCAPDATDLTGATALTIAAQYNHAKVVFWLTKHVPSVAHIPDRDGDTAMHWAAYNGALACMSLLCEYGLSPLGADTYGSTALHLAVSRDHEAAVRWLLVHPDVAAMLAATDVNGRTPLRIAQDKGLGMMKWLLTDGLVEKRSTMVQRLQKNLFTAYHNFNHWVTRVQVEGAEKAAKYGDLCDESHTSKTSSTAASAADVLPPAAHGAAVPTPRLADIAETGVRI